MTVILSISFNSCPSFYQQVSTATTTEPAPIQPITLVGNAHVVIRVTAEHNVKRFAIGAHTAVSFNWTLFMNDQ